jgi:hypothetical protein
LLLELHHQHSTHAAADRQPRRRNFRYNLFMLRRLLLCSCLYLLSSENGLSGQAPPAPSASSARILLLPKRIVTEERATLAVLDAGGRLTPGVTVNFSNGDRLVTDTTGRALFVAPSNPGVIYAAIAGRQERVYTTILTHPESPANELRISVAPRFASLADRFELSGSGFCGQADANVVRIGERPALVLAASPAFLSVLPPSDLPAGSASVELTCAKRSAPPVSIALLDLSLEADNSPLASGEHRPLLVRVRGTDGTVPLEARNLAPYVAELVGGNTVVLNSKGGAENSARFEVVGRQRGSFAVSIRLVPEPLPIAPPSAP